MKVHLILEYDSFEGILNYVRVLAVYKDRKKAEERAEHFRKQIDKNNITNSSDYPTIHVISRALVGKIKKEDLN